MTELLRQESEDDDYEFKIEDDDRDERVLVMAPHGGGIEPHTDLLAREIAGDELTFYGFQGTKNDGNRVLHVTSTNFDEPQAVCLAERAQVVLAVHGKSGDGEFAMVGGRHPELVGEVETLLEELGIQTRDPPPSVAARSWDNICNRCQEGGVQLELSMALRKFLMEESQVREQLTTRIRERLRSGIRG